MQKFSIQSPRNKQNNQRGLDCMEIVCMYCSSSSSKCRKGFVSLCLQLFRRYSHNSRRGLLLSKGGPGKKKSQGTRTISRTIISTSLNQQVATLQILSEPQSTLSAVRSCSKWAQISHGSTFPNQYPVTNQDQVHISFEMPQPHWAPESPLRVEFSSATRLGAFLISLKGAQVISCRRLNPLHLLQLYWQLPQQKKGSLAGSSALHF